MVNDSLGDRMKAYENAYRFYLPKRLPVIIRIDGRAFHTVTRGFTRPFDGHFKAAMNQTAKTLCEEIAGCKLAYTQSDEISLLVTNNDTIETQPWFDNNLQKLASVAASIATLAFQKEFKKEVDYFHHLWIKSVDEVQKVTAEAVDRYNSYVAGLEKATFDARAFVLPEDEVCNYFIWRQQDAVRNSIQLVAQSLYSQNELQNKNQNDLQEMIHQKGINWNDYPIPCKRGTCIVRIQQKTGDLIRHKWIIDTAIPTFTKNRAYIDNAFVHA